MISLSNSPKYRSFIKDRDQALERMLKSHLVKQSNILRKCFASLINISLSHLDKARPDQDALADIMIVKSAEEYYSHAMFHCINALKQEQRKFLRLVHLLTISSEAEAIGRTMQKPAQYRSSSTFDTSIERVTFKALEKVKDDLKKKLHALIVAQPDISRHDAMAIFRKSLPKTKDLGERKRFLKPIKSLEAQRGDTKSRKEWSSGYIDDATWDEILNDYLDEQPVDRSFDSIVGETADKEPYYGWELERDTVNEFVKEVRSGQIQAAKDLGVTDFVVISIIDDKTCDKCCGAYGCVDFDGHTVKEIEEMTKGEQSAPPYHGNCRCALAPATDSLPPMVDDGSKEFDEWLNS